MGLVGGVLNFAGNLVGNLLGGNQYARSTPMAQGQGGSMGHSQPGLKHSWPGFKNDLFGTQVFRLPISMLFAYMVDFDL